MTSDTNQPQNQAKPSSSKSQGRRGPGWRDESGEPEPKPVSSIRAADLAPKRTKSNGRFRTRSAAPVSARFAVGFALGLFVTLFVAGAAVFGLARAYDGKIMPGVRAGTVDLSGLTRDEAISKLDSGYASLGQGKIIVTTPGGNWTITYQEAGRGPDSAAMVDAALALGRPDNPLGSLALTVRTFAVGSSVPIVVKLDPTALETRLHQMTGASAASTVAAESG